MGFFSTVEYSQTMQDNGWFSKAETAADILRAPSRWVAAEVWGGGKRFKVFEKQELLHIHKDLTCKEFPEELAQGIRKIARIFIGGILSLFGQILAIPCMSLAFLSSEIRLKHKFASRELTAEERTQLRKMIDERMKLAKERQGCEPISCLLCSICLLMCSMVCCPRNSA